MSPDFVELYEQAVDPALCRAIVARFEGSRQAVRGATGGGVDPEVKDSWDIALDAQPGWDDVRQALNDAVLAGFRRYVRRYPHVAVAPVRMQVADPATGARTTLDGERVARLDDATLNAVVTSLFRPGSINLQKYVADAGAYPYWHSEFYPHPHGDGGESLHRVVLWTIYLNDGFSAGETEFLYQDRRIVPKTGALLIAPTAFTHTHRGNMPKGGDKYIATSWILYQRREPIVAPPAVPSFAPRR